MEENLDGNDGDIFDESDGEENFVPDEENESYSSSNISVDSSTIEGEENLGYDCSTSHLSKDKSILWQENPPQYIGRIAKNQVMSNKPGPTKNATSVVTNIKSSFDLFISQNIKQLVMEMTNLRGLELYGSGWQNIDIIELDAYFGLQIMAGVLKSHGESLTSLWEEKHGRPIFRATMSLKRFSHISRCLRFDKSEDREERRQRDKLAPIRYIWDKWNTQLKVYYNPHENVTVDEQLVPFRGRCSFRQYIPSKPAKYGLKIWALCDSKSKYAWNMEVYTGRARNTQPEKNQGNIFILRINFFVYISII